MALDPVKNFAAGTASTGYDAAATSVALTTGHGARFPAPSTDGSFNLVWWNSTDYPYAADDPNVEIVRCTARSTDTLTVTRAQEGTTASTKNTAAKTYAMALVNTKKMRDDINSRLLKQVQIRIVAKDTDCAAATSVGGDFECPLTGTIEEVGAYVDTAGTTGTMTVDINKAGTTIMTTNKVTIDSTEKSSRTAATSPGITTSSITAGDILTFDIDAVHTTAAKGLTIRLAIRE